MRCPSMDKTTGWIRVSTTGYPAKNPPIMSPRTQAYQTYLDYPAYFETLLLKRLVPGFILNMFGLILISFLAERIGTLVQLKYILN